MNKRYPILTAALLASCMAIGVNMPSAIDLADREVRMRQPTVSEPSYAGGVVEGPTATGNWAYRLRATKSWVYGLPFVPSAALKTSVSDWSGYDRLVLDLYNDAEGGDRLSVTAQGRTLGSRPLAQRTFDRWILRLADFPKEVDQTRITGFNLELLTPAKADVTVSSFALLRPGEEPPPIGEAYRRDVIARDAQAARDRQFARRRASVRAFLADCRAAGQTGDPAWFGSADSMAKVMPRDAFAAQAARTFELSLARGETEALQVVVLPEKADLVDVSVAMAGPLRRTEGGADVLAASAFSCAPVGYVEAKRPVPYRPGANVSTNLPGGYWRATKEPVGGWWPDPILSYLTKADVKRGDAQSFWVSVRCPDGQAAGWYSGRLAVSGRGWRREFPLRVRVFGFDVPKGSPLPLALTFAPHTNARAEAPDEVARVAGLRNRPEAPVNAWKRHEREWEDFLADRYITCDNLYRRTDQPRWELLSRMKAEGRLGWFNLGYWGYPKDLEEKTLEAWRKDVFPRIDAAYRQAKERGLLERAYLYGCDEIGARVFPNAKWAISEMRKRYPGVPLMTTADDQDFGKGSELSEMDIFVPITPKYHRNFAKVEPARASGHQVWWYVCNFPIGPYANFFLEHDGLEPRMLMGAQTVLYRPQGFLFYSLAIWNSDRCIEGPDTFTDWDPRGYANCNGEGSWCCVGPDGTPLTTIRLENFRDGLEDYAYALEYERRTGRRCDVPPEVCRDVMQYTDDPARIRRWRMSLAEAIEAAR